MLPPTLPKYKNLSIPPGMPARTSWNLFSTPTHQDSLGTLNQITTFVTLSAASEIRSGVSVSLNWGLENLDCAGFGRQKLERKVVDWRKEGLKAAGSEEKEGGGGDGGLFSFDDELRFNTQIGSQWDGLRHWGHSKTGFYYQGIHHNDLLATPHLGIEHISQKGGLCTRGILIDYPLYCSQNNISFNPMSTHSIPLSTLTSILASTSTIPRAGDILLLRTGFLSTYHTLTPSERTSQITNGSAWIGVLGDEAMVEWLWDTGIAAVAADNMGFECWPPVNKEWMLHDHLLACLGMPIGELWDLEGLAKECERNGRWSFFLTSAPLNVRGGIASPPNALAVF
ncbi:Putative cyclase [Glarea lozoyensis ATCC 20868]|uniref:Putative cyclase n=1 Tax=Glarea lozoyensis (strain ATCC 20868 / MF5171) TaxID=1116229 RepID=S3D4G2_GLAL2|nr:Putative cyclase [Glarea lozoyensis ATCC 20868]EPE33317.1 Putative cyclase [Glarea lozoyensis ATCC 20868]